MASAVMESNRAYLNFGNGIIREARFRVDPTNGSNLLEVVFFDQNGVELGTPRRFKGTDNGMIAADSPGVSDQYFTVDSGGHNTDG